MFINIKEYRINLDNVLYYTGYVNNLRVFPEYDQDGCNSEGYLRDLWYIKIVFSDSSKEEFGPFDWYEFQDILNTLDRLTHATHKG